MNTNNVERKEISSGILVYRIIDEKIQVLLGKNGGPRWIKKSVGAWNIPKGHIEGEENLLDGAIREFMEETSLNIDIGDVTEKIYLGSSKTSSGKIVHIFAINHDYASSPEVYKVNIKSNMCETEWPIKSGKMIMVPELSEAYYFKLDVARRMIFPYQKIFLDRLEEALKSGDQSNEEVWWII